MGDKQIILFTLLIGIVILSGCETLYIPNAVHSPMLTNKGEGHVSTSLGCIGTGLANVDAAYAVTDHFGIMADGMFHYKTSSYDDYNYQSDMRETVIYYGSIGMGYFEKMGTKGNFALQFYGGGGYGDSRSFLNSDASIESDVTANYYDFYAQPGMVLNTKYIDFGFDVRMKYVQMYNFKSYVFDPGFNDEYNYSSDYTREFALVEPNFTLLVGGKHLKGKLQSGFTIPIVNGQGYFDSNSGDFYLDSVFKLNMGITYVFGRKEPVKVKF